ncbi:MAG: hypothetical protein JW882_12955 [Deltaproteobacteria bacterium]|nr:hypothetical protein [Deltaproteobacteria bacterium]
MSVINEALKKAQQRKEIRDIEFARVLSSAKGNSKIPSGRIIFYSVILVSALFFMFRPYQFWDTGNDEPAAVKGNVIPETGHERVQAPEMLYQKAKEFHNTGRMSEAKDLYLKILELDPGYTDALNNLGVISIHEKEYTNARKYLEKAVLLKPGNAIPYYNMACLLSIEGDTEASIMYLKNAVSMDEAVRDWARKDIDLGKLRGISDFEKIIEAGLK